MDQELNLLPRCNHVKTFEKPETNNESRVVSKIYRTLVFPDCHHHPAGSAEKAVIC